VTRKNTIAPVRNEISPPHGAGTTAVAGRIATRSTSQARHAITSARSLAKSRRVRIQCSNHARGRRSRYGITKVGIDPTTTQNSTYAMRLVGVRAPGIPTPCQTR
jgi:hypothetical protein